MNRKSIRQTKEHSTPSTEFRLLKLYNAGMSDPAPIRFGEMTMTARTLFIAVISVLLVSSLAVVADEKSPPKETVELHLSLKRDEAGRASLFLDMPVDKDFLQSLIDGKGKHLVATVTVARDINVDENLKTFDMLGQLGVDVKQDKRP